MKLNLLLVLTVGVASAQVQGQRPRERTAEIRNTKWFTGSTFVLRTMYVSGTRFTTRRPSRIDERIDLAGHFIVAPYGDAHTHAFGIAVGVGVANTTYVREGVFYALNLLNMASIHGSYHPSSRQHTAAVAVSRPTSKRLQTSASPSRPALTSSRTCRAWRSPMRRIRSAQ